MGVLALSVTLVLVVSAFCSLSEAALYSVRVPYVRKLAETGSRAGIVLDYFKRSMERPITAILIINTLANTAGAALAGAQARTVWGDAAETWFPLSLAFAVLVFSEVLPKVAGVSYDQPIARLVALPWAAVTWLLSPFIWVAQQMTRPVQRSDAEPQAPEEEIHHVAALSAEEGSILPFEAELVQNVLRLDEIQARDIMTPRTVVFQAPEHATVQEVASDIARCPYSRIPIYDEEEEWTGFIFKNDVLQRLANDEFEVPLSALREPLPFVPEFVPGHRLLAVFLKRRGHLLGVVDEYGGTRGIVTLEDVMETLLGHEIVDETDRDVDLQAKARRLAKARSLERRAEDLTAGGLVAEAAAAAEDLVSEEDETPTEDGADGER